MRLFFILPGFVNFSGHDGAFINTLNTFAKTNNYKLEVISSEKNYINIDFDHHKIIPDNNKNIFLKIINIFALIKNFFNFLNLNKINYDDKILIDGGSYYQQLGLALSFLLYRNKIKNIYIYYRIDFEKNFIKKIIMQFILFSLNNTSKNNLIILTDSEALSNLLSQRYKYINYVMPIPHLLTNNIDLNESKNENSIIKIWLPGPIRKDKGISNLHYLLKNIRQKKSNIKILINEKSKVEFSSLENIEFLKSNMPRDEYISLFRKNNIIILPYNDPSYKTRTSGIFLECISIGKKVLVSSNTYMADELIKYGLSDLVVDDWSNIDLITQIKEINLNNNLQLLLFNMRDEYIKKHGDLAYQKKLNEIFR